METSWVYSFMSDFGMPAVAFAVGWTAREVARWRSRHRYDFNGHHIDDIRIHETLAELRVVLSAQRAYLAKFHNGQSYIDGSDILKMSRTHEVVMDGVSYQTADFQDMLISRYPEQMTLILEDGPGFIKTSEIKEGSRFRGLKIAGGVRSSAYVGVRKGRELVGFVGVDFAAPERPANIDLLIEYSGRIENLL
jgi:hypothetical protein